MSGSTSALTSTTSNVTGTSGSTDTFTPIYQVTKTILGKQNDLELELNLTPAYDTQSTLNAKYSVYPTQKPATHPTVKYFGIGINGRFNVDTTNLTQPRQPLATNMDIYTPIPFRAVPVANDLDATERALYRMRVVRSIGGVQYALYYLKLITQTDTSVELSVLNSTSDSQQTYTLDYSNLTPTPPTTTIDSTTTAVAGEINVMAATAFPVTGAEVIEAINVLYGGDLRYAFISEVGIYSGTDATVQTTDSSGNAFTYTESIMTQLDTHYCFNGTDMSSPTASYNPQFYFGSGKIALI